MNRLPALLALALLPAAFAAPAAAQDDKAADVLPNAASPEVEVKTLFRQGLKAYLEGKYDEAYQKMETALARDPADDLILYMRNEMGMHVLMQMVGEGWRTDDPARKKLGDTALRIIRLSQPFVDRIRKDPAVIQGYIEGLKKTDFSTVWTSILHLVNIGPWAIPYLVNNDVLGNEKEDDYRTNAILCLRQMNQDAVWPLIEALESKNGFLRQNAAIVLGHINDERAIAALKRAVENPNEAKEVRFRAAESLLKITGAAAIDDLKTAREYYYLLGEKYYYSQPSVIRTFGFDWVSWSWDDASDSLLMREVPPFTLNEIVAEESCYDGLGVAPDYAPLWSLLACVHAAQVVETSLALESADESVKFELMRPEEAEKIKKQVETYERGRVLKNLPGHEHLYRALTRSLEDETSLVSVEILRSIQEMARPDDLPPPSAGGAKAPAAGEAHPGYPLIRALTDPDKRVRYASASALLHLNPPQAYLGYDHVMINLVDAVGEMGVRVVLVIHDERDSDDRRAIADIKKKLVSLNCFPVVATTPREGIAKAKGFPSADLVLMQSKMGREVAIDVDLPRKHLSESAWEALRDDVRTRAIPRYVLCEDAADMEAAKKIYEDQAWEYLTKPMDRLDLKNRLDKTFAAPEAQKDSKTRAETIAQEAAEGLANLRPDRFDTIYPFADAVPALVKNLDPEHQRPDAIRIPCIQALGRFGDARALDILAKVLDEKGNDAPTVRAAAAKALSDIYRQTRLTPSTEIFDILKKAVVDGELKVEVNAGEAVGNAALTDEQRVEFERHRRLHREKYKPGIQMQQ